MSESTHHIFKGEFMRYKPISDRIALQKHLNDFVYYYNHQRFPIELHGYSPIEVLQGAIPDKHRFKNDIRIAWHRRYLENKHTSFCKACI